MLHWLLMIRSFHSPAICKPLESESPADCQGFNPALFKQDGGQIKAGCGYVSNINCMLPEIRVEIVKTKEKIAFSQVANHKCIQVQ